MNRSNINQACRNVTTLPQHNLKKYVVQPNRKPFINPHDAEIFQQGFEQGYACAMREIMEDGASIDDIVTRSDHGGVGAAGKGGGT